MLPVIQALKVIIKLAKFALNGKTHNFLYSCIMTIKTLFLVEKLFMFTNIYSTDVC